MQKFCGLLVLLVVMLVAAPVFAAEFPKVKVETSLGDFVVELDPGKAPKTVSNFLYYVKTGYYNNTIFHRVIDGFMIQGGGFTENMEEQPTKRAAIENEAANGLKNKRYSIAMARTQDPHSATSQFFINVKDNAFLDYTNNTVSGFGYAVFGRVIKGMDVVDKIKMVETGRSKGASDVPIKPVIIKAITPLVY